MSLKQHQIIEINSLNDLIEIQFIISNNTYSIKGFIRNQLFDISKHIYTIIELSDNQNFIQINVNELPFEIDHEFFFDLFIRIRKMDFDDYLWYSNEQIIQIMWFCSYFQINIGRFIQLDSLNVLLFKLPELKKMPSCYICLFSNKRYKPDTFYYNKERAVYLFCSDDYNPINLSRLFISFLKSYAKESQDVSENEEICSQLSAMSNERFTKILKEHRQSEEFRTFLDVFLFDLFSKEKQIIAKQILD